MIPNKIKSHIRVLHTKASKKFNNLGKSFFLIAGILITTLIGGVITFFVSHQELYTGKIYPHVYIDNVLVSNKTVENIEDEFAKKNKELAKLNLNVFYGSEQIATFSAETINIHYNGKEVAAQAYSVGRSSHFPTRIKDVFVTLTGLGSYRFNSRLEYKKGPLDNFVKQTAEDYDKPAKDAKFAFEDGKVVSFEKDEPGQAIDQKQFYADFEKVLLELRNNPKSYKITLQKKIVEPEVTLAEANKFGIEELIGEGKSDYSGSSEDRVYNLILAASKFNGVLVPPGEEFSFNKIIGDISSNTGYRPSYIIKNGQTVLGDGGGVCQVSTTVFRAAMNTGLPITERHAHAYRVGYYENDSKPGFDATIYTPDVDFKFKNDTEKHILVQTEVDRENRMLYFRFYGKKDGRTVELSDATVTDVAPPPPDRMQDDPNLPKGTVKQADFAAWGAKSRFTYKVVKDGKITFEKEFFSSYRPWQAVYLVGQG